MSEPFAIVDKFSPPPRGISVQHVLKVKKLRISAGKYPPFVILWIIGAWLVVSSMLIILIEGKGELLYGLTEQLFDRYSPSPTWFVCTTYIVGVSLCLVVLLITFLFLAHFYRVKITISSNDFAVSGMREKCWPLVYYMKIGLADLRNQYKAKQHIELTQISPKLDKRGLDPEQTQWINNVLGEMVTPTNLNCSNGFP